MAQNIYHFVSKGVPFKVFFQNLTAVHVESVAGIVSSEVMGESNLFVLSL